MTRSRPTHTVASFLSETGWLLRRGTEVYAIWLRRRIDPVFREELMLTVARANSCRICSYVHREWALSSGLPEDELAALEGLDAESFDARRWAAIAYVQALTQTEFESVPEPIEANFCARYSEHEQRDIVTVARAMAWANRLGNTLDSLVGRRRGEPFPGSRARDEIIVGGIAVITLGPPAVLVARRRGTPLREVLRDFDSFSKGFEHELRAE